MIKVARPSVGEEELEAVCDVLRSGNYAAGKKVREFEEQFADFIGVRHAVAVNSGTAALHTILAAQGIGQGDEVIVPPLTFFATISAVLFQNAAPVFADIAPDTYCIDPLDVERRISNRTKAIIVVHLFGQAADLEGLLRIGERFGIPVIEDCAQAHGTAYRGEKVGSFGLAGAFSFYATKHLSTGEGGMITTNSAVLAEQSRLIRSHGMVDYHTHVLLGHNYRMNEIAAAMGLPQIKKLPLLNAMRAKNSLYLIRQLSSLEWLTPPTLRDDREHTFFWVPFLVNEEKLGFDTGELVSRLNARGVEVRRRYHEPLYRQQVFTAGRSRSLFSCRSAGSLDYRALYLPQAERIAGRLIGLPNHPALSREELDTVVQTIVGIQS